MCHLLWQPTLHLSASHLSTAMSCIFSVSFAVTASPSLPNVGAHPGTKYARHRLPSLVTAAAALLASPPPTDDAALTPRAPPPPPALCTQRHPAQAPPSPAAHPVRLCPLPSLSPSLHHLPSFFYIYFYFYFYFHRQRPRAQPPRAAAGAPESVRGRRRGRLGQHPRPVPSGRRQDAPAGTSLLLQLHWPRARPTLHATHRGRVILLSWSLSLFTCLCSQLGHLLVRLRVIQALRVGTFARRLSQALHPHARRVSPVGRRHHRRLHRPLLDAQVTRPDQCPSVRRRRPTCHPAHRGRRGTLQRSSPYHVRLGSCRIAVSAVRSTQNPSGKTKTRRSPVNDGRVARIVAL